MTDKQRLIELAELEEAIAAWLYAASAGPPIIHSAHDAALVAVNRASALRALAEEIV